jgi:hypothetical protein
MDCYFRAYHNSTCRVNAYGIQNQVLSLIRTFVILAFRNTQHFPNFSALYHQTGKDLQDITMHLFELHSFIKFAW